MKIEQGLSFFFVWLALTCPTLVIHGDADRILPITASGLRTAKLIKGSRQVVVKGAALHHLDPRGSEH